MAWKFDPLQHRDAHGRWSASGGAAGDKALVHGSNAHAQFAAHPARNEIGAHLGAAQQAIKAGDNAEASHHLTNALAAITGSHSQALKATISSRRSKLPKQGHAEQIAAQIMPPAPGATHYRIAAFDKHGNMLSLNTDINGPDDVRVAKASDALALVNKTTKAYRYDHENGKYKPAAVHHLTLTTAGPGGIDAGHAEVHYPGEPGKAHWAASKKPIMPPAEVAPPGDALQKLHAQVYSEKHALQGVPHSPDELINAAKTRAPAVGKIGDTVVKGVVLGTGAHPYSQSATVKIGLTDEHGKYTGDSYHVPMGNVRLTAPAVKPAGALTGDAAHAHVKRVTGLSPGEKQALADYGMSWGYRTVNPYHNQGGQVFDRNIMALRPANAKETADAKRITAGLDGAFAKAQPTTQDIQVSRGVSNAAAMFGEPGSMVGKQFSSKAYVSTTTVKGADTGYGYGYSKSGHGMAKLSITVPAGSKVVPANDFEKELLLPRGSSFQVKSDTVMPDGTRAIELRYQK